MVCGMLNHNDTLLNSTDNINYSTTNETNGVSVVMPDYQEVDSTTPPVSRSEQEHIYESAERLDSACYAEVGPHEDLVGREQYC